MTIDDIRNTLRTRMCETATSQTALAKKYGLEQAALSRFLAGKTALSLSYVLTLWPFIFDSPPEAPHD